MVGWDKEDLEDLLDYLKAKETPATVQLLSTNSRTTLEKGVEAVNLTPNGKKLDRGIYIEVDIFISEKLGHWPTDQSGPQSP